MLPRMPELIFTQQERDEFDAAGRESMPNSVITRILQLDIPPADVGSQVYRVNTWGQIPDFRNGFSLGLYLHSGPENFIRVLNYSTRHMEALGRHYMLPVSNWGMLAVNQLGFHLLRDEAGELPPYMTLKRALTNSKVAEALVHSAIQYADCEGLDALLSFDGMVEEFPSERLVKLAASARAPDAMLEKLIGEHGRLEVALSGIQQQMCSDSVETIDERFLIPLLLECPHEIIRGLRNDQYGNRLIGKKFCQVMSYLASNGADLYPSFRVYQHGQYAWLSAAKRVPDVANESAAICAEVLRTEQSLGSLTGAFLMAVPDDFIAAHAKGGHLFGLKYLASGDKSYFKRASASFKNNHAGRTLSI
ncbi:hypothetical protein ACYPKM_05425 [Pseudomonas aeruginosa]